MGAFVVVLPDKTEIEAGDVEQAFKRRFELVPGGRGSSQTMSSTTAPIPEGSWTSVPSVPH